MVAVSIISLVAQIKCFQVLFNIIVLVQWGDSNSQPFHSTEETMRTTIITIQISWRNPKQHQQQEQRRSFASYAGSYTKVNIHIHTYILRYFWNPFKYIQLMCNCGRQDRWGFKEWSWRESLLLVICIGSVAQRYGFWVCWIHWKR